MIMIGLNTGAAATASFEGHRGNPNIRPKGDAHYIALTIILIIVFVIVIFVYIITGRKNEEGKTYL